MAILIAGWLIYGLFAGSREQDEGDDRIRAVATIFPVYDFARQIGGSRADVLLLLPPGAEAHHYEPKPSDLAYASKSDIFIYVSDQMEPWAGDMINGVGRKDLFVAEAGGGAIGNGTDPHIWLDFVSAQAMVEQIAGAFIFKDPDGALVYERNKEVLIDSLKSLDREYSEKLGNCGTKRFLFAGHNAFGYLAQRYGLEYTAVQGLSPDAEPTPAALADASKSVEQENIKYIFYEELDSPGLAETIAGNSGAELLKLNPGHNLPKEDFEKDLSFQDIMRKNLNNLSIGFGCD